MVIIGLTDIHGSMPEMERLETLLSEADVILLVGDITNFGTAPAADAVVAPMMHSAKRLFAISGNCDYKEVDEYLSQKEINLHGKGEIIESIGFVGLGGSLITPFNTPNEYTEEELARALQKGITYLPDDLPLILVSHQPPADTACDRIGSGAHVGSASVRDFIEKHQPLVCFTGHIHESAGMDKIGITSVINPGPLRKGAYAYAEIINGTATAEIRRLM